MSQETLKLLEERGKTHGDYSQHALVTQLIKGAYISGNYNKMGAEIRESLDMIAHKLGRILSGDPTHRDHWDDISGYAMLISKLIDKHNEAMAVQVKEKAAEAAFEGVEDGKTYE